MFSRLFNRRTLQQNGAIYIGLLSLLSMGGYLLASRLTHGTGFPLDDAWIHQTYARNLGASGEWSFIPGQPSAGSTSPLWTVILAVGHAIRVGPFLWTFLLGWILLWLIGWIGMQFFQSIAPDRPKWAIAAGLLLVIEWHLVWAAASGMETALFSLIVLLVLVWISRDKIHWFPIGCVIGLSIWVRPDGLSLIGPAVAIALFHPATFKQKILRVFLLLAGILLFFAPYLIWNMDLTGALWPNTFYAKQTEYAVELLEPLWKRLLEQSLLPNVGVGIVLLPGFLRMMVNSLRARRWGLFWASIWVVGYLVLYALRLPVTYQHGRYVMPMMPIYFLIGLGGVIGFVRTGSTAFKMRVFSKVWLISIFVICLSFWFLGARSYARDVAFIDTEMVTVAHWVAENTQENALIAAHDIGALGYYGERKLLDLAGLVSPEVIPFIRDEAQLARWIDESGATYLVTFPGWYPILTKDLTPIYRSGGKFSQAFGGENMAVYRWDLRLR